MTLVSVLVLLLTWLFVPDSPTRTRIKIDFLGAALLGSPLALIVVAIGQANAWGWTSALTLGLLGLAVLLLIAWAVWEVTFPFPMIDLRIVKRREIWPALLAGGLAGVLGPSSTLTISNWVQTPISAGYGFGGNVLTAGIYLIPVGVAIGFSASLARPIIKRIGQRASVILGGLISAGVFSWFAGNHTETWQYFVVMAVFGVGWALTTTGAISNYLRHARPGEGGMITGAGRIAQTGLSAVGPTIITALITASFVQGTAVPQSDNYSHVYIFFAVCGLLVIGLGLAMRDSRINHQLAPHTEVIGSGVVSVGEAAG